MNLQGVRDVCLEEGSVLSLIREFFELSGHAECLLALEHSCTGVTPQPPLPLELAVLRDITLSGKWDHVMKYLDRFNFEGSQEGLRKCLYLAHKQKFLEILYYVESNIQDKLRLGFANYCRNGQLLDAEEAFNIRSVVDAELEVLESLCPSVEDFQSLQELLALPSISSSKEFSSWDLHSGRLDTLYNIQNWITKILYLNVKFPSLQADRSKDGIKKSGSLMRLLAKGLLYEQCERLCKTRSGDPPTTVEQEQEDKGILDLRGWIQHQPDSAFQLPPSQLHLVILPWTKPKSSQVSVSVDMGVVSREHKISLYDHTATPTTTTTKLAGGGHSQPTSVHQGTCPTNTNPSTPTANNNPSTTNNPISTSNHPTSPSSHPSATSNSPMLANHPMPSNNNQLLTGDSRYESQAPLATTHRHLSLRSHPIPTNRSDPHNQDLNHYASAPAPSPMPTPGHSHPAPNSPAPTQVYNPAPMEEHREILGANSLRNAGERGGQQTCATAAGWSGAHGEGNVEVMAESRRQPYASGNAEFPQQLNPSDNQINPAVSDPNNLAPRSPLGSSDRLVEDMKKSLYVHEVEVEGGQVQHVESDHNNTNFISTTPLQKTGRGSSTPKNPKASQGSLKSSPPSSPIAVAVPGHQMNGVGAKEAGKNTLRERNVARGTAEQGARKCIDFSNRVEETSTNWPAATLVGVVKDAQAVRSVSFSGSGSLIAVGANSGTLRLCQAAALIISGNNHSSKEVSVFYEHPRHHRGSIYCLDWYKDSILASGSNDKSVSLLFYSPDNSKATFTIEKPFPLHSGTIRDLTFLPDGLLAYGGGVSPEITVVDMNTYKSTVTLNGHTDQVLTLGVLPGGLLASGAQDNTVLLWDMRSPIPVSSLDVGTTVASLTCSGNHLVTSHLDGSYSMYDLYNFKLLSTCRVHTKECRSVRYHPKARLGRNLVLSGSYDHSVSLTDTETIQGKKLCEHSDKVIQCRWHPEGNLFASTGADKQACFWVLE